MSYKIAKADGTSVIVKDMTKEVAGGLNLIGYGFANYGDEFAQNFVTALENNASQNEPVNPLLGQFWVRLPVDLTTGNKDLLICVSTAGVTLQDRWEVVLSISPAGSVILDAYTLRGLGPVDPSNPSSNGSSDKLVILDSTGKINSAYLPAQTIQSSVDSANRLTTARVFGSRSGGLVFDGTQDVPLTTAHIAEGDQLYYTSARAQSDARASMAAGSGLTYDPSTGTFSLAGTGVGPANFTDVGIGDKLWFGGVIGNSYNTDGTYMTMIIDGDWTASGGAQNVTELAIHMGDDGSGTLLTVPTGTGAYTDFVTIRSNDGVHHMLGTDGTYTAGGNIKSLGQVMCQTPSGSTTGGLRIKVNSSNAGIIQIIDASETAQIGWLQMDANNIAYNGNLIFTLANGGSGSGFNADMVDGHHASDFLSIGTFTGTGSQSITGNGYQFLPGGLLIQWGRLYIPANSNSSSTFPITFPHACFAAVMNGVGELGTFGGEGATPTIYSFTTSSFFWHTGDDNGCYSTFIAIGY